MQHKFNQLMVDACIVLGVTGGTILIIMLFLEWLKANLGLMINP